MIENEWHKEGNYVRIERRINDTETTPTVREIVTRIGTLRSCHPYDENLLAHFIDKLSKVKEERQQEEMKKEL